MSVNMSTTKQLCSARRVALHLFLCLKPLMISNGRRKSLYGRFETLVLYPE